MTRKKGPPPPGAAAPASPAGTRTIAALLAAVTIAAFLPVFTNGFVNYDDPGYVTHNPEVLAGITPGTIAWAFTAFREANWHPLTWISHALDVTLFGLHAPSHHGMSLLLHALSTVLLFLALDRMTGARWPSAFVAVVFGIHPLHVESVAWLSERKDVLSGLFMMLVLLSYERYIRTGRRSAYAWTIVLFALGLMAKPMLVTVPFVLLLLDFWPLRRLRFGAAEGGSARYARVPLSRLVVEKIPLFLLSAGSSVVTYAAQKIGGSMADAELLLQGGGAWNSITAYVAYLRLTLHPVDLACFYPHPMGSIPFLEVAGAAAILLVVSAAVWRWRRPAPALVTGWAIYLGMLVPVIGIVQVGLQARADRYMYLPSIGLAMMAAWGLPLLLRSSRARRMILGPAFAAAVVLMGVLTWRQTGVWKDDVTLYTHALAVTEGNHIAHTNYGVYLTEQGKDAEAIPHFREALRLWPTGFNNQSNLARSLGAVGRYGESLAIYREIIRQVPPNPLLFLRVGDVFAGLGEADSALAWYRRSIDIDPAMVEAHLGMADVLSARGEFAAAREAAGKVFKISPRHPKAHDMLGIVAGREGRIDEAEEEFRKAIAADSLYDQAWLDLGILYEKSGREGESRVLYETAARLNPANAMALYQHGMALARANDLAGAEREWLRCAAVQPSRTDVKMALARLYTLQRKPDAAAAQYRAAIAADPARADAHFLLGNLLAGRGDRAGAERHYREALRLEPGFEQAAEALGRIVPRPGG